MRSLTCLLVMALAATTVSAQGLVDFDGTELGLIGYTNPIVTYTGAGFGTNAALVSTNGTSGWSPGDAIWPMTRAALGPNGVGMPFSISDDSVVPAAGNTVFPGDTQGFAGVNFQTGFFGITDTENGMNSGPIEILFSFDITGLSNIGVSADFAAMGDFEAADAFNFEYRIDGGAWQPLFTSSVDENGAQNYLMDSGTTVSLDDPLLINGTLLDDNWQTLSAPVMGAGSTLDIRLSAMTDGGTEGFGFDNLSVVPEPASLILLALAGVFIRRR